MTYEQAVCAKVLIEQAQKKDGKHSISYKKLTEKIKEDFGIYIHYRSKLGEVIGDISHCLKKIEKYSNAPLISVLVVNKNTGRPGENFWILYHDIKGINVSQDERKDKYNEEVKLVLEYGWSDISKMADEIIKKHEI